MIKDMSSGVGSLLGMNLSDVLKSPEEYSENSARLMETISVTAVRPVSTAILVVLFVLELQRILLRSDGNEDTMLKSMLFAIGKFVVLWWSLRHVTVFLNGIYELFAVMGTRANEQAQVFTGGESNDLQVFADGVDRMDVLGKSLLMILLLVAWLVNKGAVVLALALVVLRFVKLYMFTAFGPLPLSFLAFEDTRPWAVGFIRNFVSTCLQGVAIVVAFAVYRSITGGWAESAVRNLPDNQVQAALTISTNYILMGLVLGMVVLGSGRMANELVGS